ncbi:hypothetical protein D3C73_1246710 [compost metagenome]
MQAVQLVKIAACYRLTIFRKLVLQISESLANKGYDISVRIYRTDIDRTAHSRRVKAFVLSKRRSKPNLMQDLYAVIWKAIFRAGKHGAAHMTPSHINGISNS